MKNCPTAANLTIYTEQQTEKILGQDTVEGIVIKDLKTGNSKQLDVTGVFIEIGLVPNSDMVKDLVKLNQVGEVQVNAPARRKYPVFLPPVMLRPCRKNRLSLPPVKAPKPPSGTPLFTEIAEVGIYLEFRLT